MEALIFSKDRPMQLDLCLRSHIRFWGEKITVLYTVSEKQYQEGYNLLSTRYPQVNFVRELNFKNQVIEYVKRNKYVVFFCDDDVMIRQMEKFEDVLQIPEVVCVSMRLAPHYDYHWETESVVPVPEIKDGFWKWKDAELDWHFPMSVLGHIFHRSDFLPLAKVLIYSNPNQFESALADNPIAKPYMYCFDKAKNINIPANLVQHTYRNRAGEVSVEELNQRFLKGEQIDLDDVIEKTKDARSCFTLIKFKFKEAT